MGNVVHINNNNGSNSVSLNIYYDKDADLGLIKDKKIVILGSKNIPAYTEALTQLTGDKILGTAPTMPDAVKLARDSAEPGDVILLSPGFASFDLFQNEFDRGRQFNQVVQSYAQN